MRRLVRKSIVVLAILALAGCGRLNRSATINQTAQAPGAGIALALQQLLAQEGFPNARVSCAKSIIINVGTRTSCTVAGAAKDTTVSFTFNGSHAIDPGSVRVS